MSTSSSRRTSVTIRNIRLTALFSPEEVIHPTSSTTGDAAVEELLMRLALHYGIGNIKHARAEVASHTAKNGAIVKPGLAVVYARLEKVMEPLLAMATSQGGVAFEDGVANLVVLVLTPIDMPGAYTQILRGLEKYCEEEGAALGVAGLQSPLAVWQYFESGGHRLPDHLQARHIMDNLKTCLHATDSLATAVDKFLEFNTPELPVLTEDGEIIGVATLKRLVRICMPDYLMWLDNMEAFLNFEPLAAIMQNESATWIRDIMTRDFASVQADAPAVLAMKEIAQRETLNAYVLQERRVVGVIRLLDFAKSVLR